MYLHVLTHLEVYIHRLMTIRSYVTYKYTYITCKHTYIYAELMLMRT